MSLVVGSAPWITAFEVEPLAEQRVEPAPEASAPLKAAVKGLNGGRPLAGPQRSGVEGEGVGRARDAIRAAGDKICAQIRP
jgi:hypothetical protein